jgi:hypothetical protein
MEKNGPLELKIGETWHSQAGWNAKDDSGNLTGAIKIKLTPNNNPSAVPQSAGNKGFAKAPISGNKPEYRF